MLAGFSRDGRLGTSALGCARTVAIIGRSPRDSVGDLGGNRRSEASPGVHDGEMDEPTRFEVTVALAIDGTTGIRFSDTDRPADSLRAAASALERLAVSIEREDEPILCTTCGA